MKKPNSFRGILRPEVLLILLALGLATAALFPADMQDAIDVHLHDTYYVIARNHFCLLMAIPVALVAVIYFLTRNFRQWAVLQYFHVACIVVFLYLLLRTKHAYPGSGEDGSVPVEDSLFMWTFLLGNLAFLINLIAGFVRGKKVNA